MTPQTPLSAQIEAGRVRLDELVKRMPELAGAVAFYRLALPAFWQARQEVPPFTLEPAWARQKLESGLPLLVDENLPLDGQATAAFFLHLCQIIEETERRPANKAQRNGWSLFKRGATPLQMGEQTGDGNGAASGTTLATKSPAARQIHDAVRQGHLDLGDVWAAIATGDTGRVTEVAARLQLDSGLLHILAQNSLKPALHAWAEGLNDVANLDRWRRGHCPMCGNTPALSEIQGKEGQRRLRCTMCGAGWYYPRLQCAFCQSQDYKVLGYIAVEGEEEKLRLQTCDACRGYLKVIVTYDPIPTAWLAVEDLATLHLDAIAASRGFTRSARQRE
jgi:hypothetical protein